MVKAKPKAPKQVALIDGRRTQNVNISLGRLAKKFPDLDDLCLAVVSVSY